MQKCTCCGQEFPYLNIVSDDQYVCDDCLEMNYQQCDICHEYYGVESVEYYEDIDKFVCEGCAEDLELDLEED